MPKSRSPEPEHSPSRPGWPSCRGPVPSRWPPAGIRQPLVRVDACVGRADSVAASIIAAVPAPAPMDEMDQAARAGAAQPATGRDRVQAAVGEQRYLAGDRVGAGVHRCRSGACRRRLEPGLRWAGEGWRLVAHASRPHCVGDQPGIVDHRSGRRGRRGSRRRGWRGERERERGGSLGHIKRRFRGDLVDPVVHILGIGEVVQAREAILLA